MRFAAVIIAALFAAPLWAVVPLQVPEVKPVHRVTVEGFVDVAHGWAWNGEQSAVDIDTRDPADDSRNWTGPAAKLLFTHDRDYREAIRNDGFIVQVRGVEVRRGAERLVVVEEIRTVAR